MYNPFSLLGKTILITGASSGIGRATAVECSHLGASVIISGRNVERLEETLSLLDRSHSQNHQIIQADLTDEDEVAKLAEKIDNIDGIACNAGVNRIKPISFAKKEDLDFVFQNNTFSTVYLIRQLLKKKKIKKGASIVFTSSVSSLYNAPGRSLYASSKAALDSLMRSFAVELADKDIRANSVHPGLVMTEMGKSNLTEEELTRNLKEYPLKRFGQPNDVALAIVYLLSPASSWVTGTVLTIDGGFMLK